MKIMKSEVKKRGKRGRKKRRQSENRSGSRINDSRKR
jgi:hypothetical protein